MFTIAEAKDIVSTYLDENKICVDGHTTTLDTLTGLINKIGEIVNIQQNFVAMYPELEGNDLPLGKDTEEWFGDLIPPVDFDASGSTTLAPHDKSYRPTSYSMDLGKKTFKATLRKDKFNKYSLTRDDVMKLSMDVLSSLANSRTLYRNTLKRGLIYNVIRKVDKTLNSGIENTDAKLVVGYQFKSGEYTHIGNNFYAVVATTTALTAGDFDTGDHFWNYAKAQVTAGNMVELHLFETMSDNTAPETTEGVAEWLFKVDEIMEKTKKESEGYSLSGNTLGVQNTNDLVLYVKDGLIPLVNRYKSTLLANSLINFDTQVKSIGEFAEYTGDVIGDAFAILVDTRGIKLSTNYLGSDSNNNGEGDFVNYFTHDGETARISPNTFIHVFAGATQV